MVRVGPDAYERALRERHAREMDFTGRPLKGFVYVLPAGYASDAGLRKWCDRGLALAASLPPKTSGSARPPGRSRKAAPRAPAKPRTTRS